MRTIATSQALILILLSSCRPAAPSSGEATVVRRDLGRFHAQFDSLYRRGDALAIARLLTDSVSVSPIETPDLRGRESIQDLLAAFFSNYTVSQYTMQLDELEVFGDAVYGRGTFRWQAAPRGQDGKVTRGRFAAVYRRGSDGHWRLHRLIENAIPPSGQ